MRTSSGRSMVVSAISLSRTRSGETVPITDEDLAAALRADRRRARVRSTGRGRSEKQMNRTARQVFSPAPRSACMRVVEHCPTLQRCQCPTSEVSVLVTRVCRPPLAALLAAEPANVVAIRRSCSLLKCSTGPVSVNLATRMQDSKIAASVRPNPHWATTPSEPMRR